MVSLYSALNTSTNTLKVYSEALGIAAGNIANTGNENYIKRVVKLESQAADGISTGVKISAIQNQFNEYLKVKLDAQSGVSQEFQVISEYLGRMNFILGDPNKPGHLSATLNSLYKSFSGLVSSPDSSTSKQNLINAAQTFTNKLKDVALGIQELRYEVDQEIKKTTDKINTLLQNIKDINVQLNSFDSGSEGATSSEQLILAKISELSKYLDIKYYKNSNNNYIVSTAKGISILDENIYNFEYSPASSLQNIIANAAFEPVTIAIAGTNNENGKQVLISGGKSSEVTSKFESGSISGLQKLRDEILTDFVERLDSMADNLIFNFNKHHNQGAGSLLNSEYIGDRPTIKEELRNWGGNLRVSVVDPDGKPIGLQSDEDPNFKLRALDIDLASLKGKFGSVAGEDLSIQDILSEINQYFMNISTQNRVKIGHQENYDSAAGIADIKLVSDQNAIVDGSNFTFDFELFNNDASNFTMEILDLSVDGTGGVVTNTVNQGFTSYAGKKQRTNAMNVVNLSGASNGTYTINAKIKVVNQDTQVVSVSNITYQVKTGQTDSFNQRFSASSASGDGVAVSNTYGATIVAPTSTSTFLTAEVVNKNGQPVGSGEAGFLSIKSIDGTKYRVVIDDNPTINGETSMASSDFGIRNIDGSATNKGFGHFYGLNNLFVEKAKELGVASSIEMNSKIVKNPALLSTAKLKPANNVKEFVIKTNKTTSAGSLKLDSVPTGGTITVNGLTFNLTTTPSSATDIDISSGTTPGIINAIVTKLNSSASVIKGNGIDLATYGVDPNDSSKISINYKTPGISGNNFAFAVNLVGGAATINEGTSSASISGTLTGGSADKPSKVLKTQYYQSILKGNNQIAQDMMFVLKEKHDFNGSNFAITQSILEFSNINITSYMSNKSYQASENYKLADLQYNSLSKNFRDGAEVDIDEELSSMIIINITMQASSKMISTISDMLANLMKAF